MGQVFVLLILANMLAEVRCPVDAASFTGISTGVQLLIPYLMPTLFTSRHPSLELDLSEPSPPDLGDLVTEDSEKTHGSRNAGQRARKTYAQHARLRVCSWNNDPGILSSISSTLCDEVQNANAHML